MGFRRRSRRRGLIAGAAIGAAAAHHHDTKNAEEEQADQYQEEQPQAAPAPVDPTDEIAKLAELHTSGALTDEEFASAKAKILGI